ncbi:MAG: hypothetical protein AB7O59_20775 [Pirellulales bacterium]
MKRKPQSPIWPYLGILACLFVLSVTAPRAWDRLARPKTNSQVARDVPQDVPPARPWPPISEQSAEAPPVPPELEPATVESELPTELQPSPAAAISLPPGPGIVPPAPEFAMQVRPAPTLAEPAPSPVTIEPEPATINAATPAEAGDSSEDNSAWPLPQVLIKQLQALAKARPNAAWATQASDLIHELCRKLDAEGRTPTEILHDLRAVATNDASEGAQDSQTVRARYALTRWLDVWEPAVNLDEVRTADESPEAMQDAIAESVRQVEALLHRGAPGPAWHEFLRLDALARLAADPDASTEERRSVARSVLDRLNGFDLTRAQRQFIGSGPIEVLAEQLRAWAAEPVGSTQLLTHLNAYEKSVRPSDARLVANDRRGLHWQESPEATDLSKHLDTHYRNANVRLSMSSTLLNRWVPQPEAVESRVHDRILNVPVYGRNTTFTTLSVKLVPDPRRIRIGLEANGLVASNTVSTSGPARLYNRGQSTFLVRKLLVLGPQGLSVWPAIAEADNNYNYLISAETSFDRVPLVGSLVQGIARSQHDNLRDEARMIVEQKVAIGALNQFDREADQRLVDAAKHIETDEVATLRRLGLELVPVGLSTTEERIVARVRLASPEQLGAHTPRPRAPSDSWASLQVHQSALNNGLESLDLDGRTFTLQELFDWVAKKLNRPELANQEDLPDDVRATFAPKDAVRVRCEQGRVDVEFSFAELRQGGNRWRNFTVRSYYLPQTEGLTPRFVREKGTIFLEGKSLRNKIALRAIFSRVLSLKRDLSLLPASITSDKRLQDLAVSQFAIEHGWIALAYSPSRSTREMARQLQ